MTQIWEGKRFKFYLWVLAAWLVLLIFYNFLNHQRKFETYMLNDLWQAIYLVVVNCIYFEYCLPFIQKKRSTRFYNILIGIFLTTLYLALLSFGLYGWTHIGTALDIYTIVREINITPGGFYNVMIVHAFYLGQAGIASAVFFGIAKVLYNNFRLKLVAQQQQIQLREAELGFLKSQTNPHFLFNTLNNIYGLATEKSDIAPESILRLSKILRFMLYETGEKFITLEQELNIIKDYIALEKLRYDDSLDIKFKSQIEDIRIQLRPLLMIPLIENAFKHGISEDIGNPFIDIDLCVADSKLLLIVKNSSESAERKTIKENIGLANLRRQLDLLYNDYELSAKQEREMFIVILKINLLSDVDEMHNNRR